MNDRSPPGSRRPSRPPPPPSRPSHAPPPAPIRPSQGPPPGPSRPSHAPPAPPNRASHFPPSEEPHGLPPVPAARPLPPYGNPSIPDVTQVDRQVQSRAKAMREKDTVPPPRRSSAFPPAQPPAPLAARPSEPPVVIQQPPAHVPTPSVPPLPPFGAGPRPSPPSRLETCPDTPRFLRPSSAGFRRWPANPPASRSCG